MQLQLPCIKRIDNLYFAINELFCNVAKHAKEVIFEQTALNKYCAQKYCIFSAVL